MRILFTNDDGIDSPGLHALVAAYTAQGHELLVVAPHQEQSGASAAIGDLVGNTHIRYEQPDIPALRDVEAYALEGPPALCVWTACLGAFGPEPDLIVSGINAGANCGRSVLFSGTIGAALTAASFGKRGLAVSLMHSRQALHWETAANLASRTTDWLVGAPERTVVNLNVPNRSASDLAGITTAPLADIGTVHSTCINQGDGRIVLDQRRAQPERGSDSDAVLEGKAVLTLLGQVQGLPADDAVAFLAQASSA